MILAQGFCYLSGFQSFGISRILTVIVARVAVSAVVGQIGLDMSQARDSSTDFCGDFWSLELGFGS